MSENAIDNENIGKAAPDTAKPKGSRKSKKAKPAKKAGRAKKSAAEPKAERANKKAEVIDMMKRAKGARSAGMDDELKLRQAGSAAPRIRCAIYTRKSTEEGLDQDFQLTGSATGGGRILYP